MKKTLPALAVLAAALFVNAPESFAAQTPEKNIDSTEDVINVFQNGNDLQLSAQFYTCSKDHYLMSLHIDYRFTYDTPERAQSYVEPFGMMFKNWYAPSLGAPLDRVTKTHMKDELLWWENFPNAEPNNKDEALFDALQEAAANDMVNGMNQIHMAENLQNLDQEYKFTAVSTAPSPLCQ